MSPVTAPARRTVRGVCPHDCPDTCALLVEVEDERVVRVHGDPDHPVTRGFLCNKVNRYHERLNHPERLLYPMIRTGTRGAGEFRRASWDEALDVVATRLTEIRDRFAGEAILPYHYGGTLGAIQNGSMDRRFFHALGASRLDETICATAGTKGFWSVCGSNQGPRPRPSPSRVSWCSGARTCSQPRFTTGRSSRRRAARVRSSW